VTEAPSTIAKTEAVMIDSIRKSFGYQFPRLGPVGFGLFSLLWKKTIDTELVPGIRVYLDLRDEIQRATYWQGARYEKPTVQVLRRWCSDAACFFDIGANYGFFSYFMLSACPQLHVYAFEPNPDTHRILQRARERNVLDSLHPVGMALSDDVAATVLHVWTKDSGRSTLGPNPDFEGHDMHVRRLTVQTTTFDAWRKTERLDLPSSPQWVAKLDVEGFELRTLTGMKEALERQSFKGLCIEVDRHNLAFCKETPERLYSFMRSHGYRAFDLHMKPTAPQEREGRNVYFLPE
jgi:FkbM family methyltransferase